MPPPSILHPSVIVTFQPGMARCQKCLMRLRICSDKTFEHLVADSPQEVKQPHPDEIGPARLVSTLR